MEEVAGANRGFFVVPSTLYLAANMAPNSQLGSKLFRVAFSVCARTRATLLYGPGRG